MNNNDKFRAWKERRRPLTINPDFSSGVMRRIHRLEEERTRPRWNLRHFLEGLCQNRLVQSAALAVAAVIGFTRLWLIFNLVLEP